MNFKNMTLVEATIVGVIFIVLVFTIIIALNPAGSGELEVDSISKKYGCTELGIEVIEYFQNGTVREVHCK